MTVKGVYMQGNLNYLMDKYLDHFLNDELRRNLLNGVVCVREVR